MALAIAILLWRYPNKVRETGKANHILGFTYFTLFYWQAMWFLLSTNLIVFFPQFYGTHIPIAFLYMPLSLLYFKTLVYARPLRWLDALHIIPAAFVLVNHLSFYLSSKDEKVTALGPLFNDPANVPETGSFFPESFIINLLYLQIAIYWIFQLLLIIKVSHNKRRKLISVNDSWLNWIGVYTAAQLFIFLPYFAVSIFSAKTITWHSIDLSQAIAGILLSASLLLKPEILFGLKIPRLSVGKELFNNITHHNSTSSGLSLSENRIAEIDGLVNLYMEREKPFLRHQFLIKEMAEDLHLPPNQLSYYLNHVKGINFPDFINQQRIKYGLSKIKGGDYISMTLDALSYECGFDNRNSFIASFKKHTGYTPFDYIKHFA